MSAGRGLRPALDRGTRMSPNGAGTDTGASARLGGRMGQRRWLLK
jgi:hypothetical protein